MSALTPAHSHWIQSHGYSNGVMTLITKTGEAYAAKIPESRYSEFLKAPSQGSFFNLYIKPFATVTKVDVAEAVALVEKAKVAVAAATSPSSRTYTVTHTFTTTAPKKARKAPAKSKLPNKPWDGRDYSAAWIDFRCIADPTTGPDLVKALEAFIAGGKDIPDTYVPMAYPCKGKLICITALGRLGSGHVDPKYLKAYTHNGTALQLKALAKAYRSAYRSWVRRQAAKQAKAASEPVKGVAYVHKASVMPSNPAVRVVAVPVGVTQSRVSKALRVLKALEAGTVTMQINGNGAKVYVWDGHNLIESFCVRTTTN